MKPFVRAFRKETPYKLLLLSLLFSSLGYGIYKGVIDNFFAETVQMTEFDRGVTEFFRELPGLMLVFILAAFYTFSAERFFRIGAVIIVIGMAMLSLVPTTKALVILATFVYSLGDHIQIGMKNTLALQYAKEGRGGRALGHLNAVSQIGCLIGFVIVAAAFIFFLSGKPYRAFFAAATVLMAISMFVSFGLRTQSATNKNNSRFYFRRKYRKYYMLEVLYGARKQVFFTFGPYVLILLYGASAEEISILFAISSVACFTMSPIVGKIIDKLGYKTVMIADTLLLAVVCFFYGFRASSLPDADGVLRLLRQLYFGLRHFARCNGGKRLRAGYFRNARRNPKDRLDRPVGQPFNHRSHRALWRLDLEDAGG